MTALTEPLHNRLKKMADRHAELSIRLSQHAVATDPQQLAELAKELNELEPAAVQYQNYLQAEAELASARVLHADPDEDIRKMAEAEIPQAQQRIATIANDLVRLLEPQTEADRRNAFIEIRAGTGGAEAALFAGDLLRMYTRYSENCRWQTEIISQSRQELGGWKEIVLHIKGRGAYQCLRMESGIHRVQRVPETESQGRIHTSACSVAVFPELSNDEAISIDKSQLRIDTYRASGAGGQHVNKTDSAVRITHLPSGIVVGCQQERSQLRNRLRAMALLQSKLQLQQTSRQRDAVAEQRRDMVGSGDRSEKIRTYNFPQGRITDHRIKTSFHNLSTVLDGRLERILDALAEWQKHSTTNQGQPES